MTFFQPFDAKYVVLKTTFKIKMELFQDRNFRGGYSDRFSYNVLWRFSHYNVCMIDSKSAIQYFLGMCCSTAVLFKRSDSGFHL